MAPKWTSSALSCFAAPGLMLAELSRAVSFIWLVVALPTALIFLSERAALGIASSASLFYLLGGIAVFPFSLLVRY